MRPRPKLLILAAAMTVGGSAIPALRTPAAANERVVVVRVGQTLGEIALQEGVSVARLVELNDLRDPNRIFAGQRLTVRAERRSSRPRTARAVTHRVAYGETLSGIATRYRVGVSALASANGIANPSYIRAGQVLSVPRAAASRNRAGRAPRPVVTHRVAYGETLSGIAIRYGVSVGALASANGIANPSFIRVGQVLTVRGASRAAARGSGRDGAGEARLGRPNGAMPPAMASVVLRRESIGRLIVAEARRQGVPAAFALAVAWQESGWQAGVVSSAGAIGVMQLLPTTAQWVGDTMLGAGVNLWNPASNVRAGVRLLKHYLDRYAGSRALALAAYYQGQSGTDRHGVYPVTRAYIGSILVLEGIFSS